MVNKIKIALVGQPNVGKSTLFNILTGGNSVVSNWPGTTVEINTAVLPYNDKELVIIDLPGIYGLSYLTEEEKVARSYIVNERPDVIVVLVDSLSMERTMFLALELMELSSNVIIVITKIDEAHSKGIHINYELIEKRIGSPVIPVSALKKIGLDNLLRTIIENQYKREKEIIIDYGELEPYIQNLINIIKQYSYKYVQKYPTRWLALKYLEDDQEVQKYLENSLGDKYSLVEEIKKECKRRIGEDISVIVSKKKIEYIKNHVLKNAYIKSEILEKERLLDKLFYNPYLAPVLSIVIIFILFGMVFTINTGYPISIILEKLGNEKYASLINDYSLSGIMEKFFDFIKNAIYVHLGESIITSLLVEGIIGGASAVLVFVPLLLLVMILLGALEDSGILPRLAVGVHVLFQKIGLSGHSLLPITLSFGCNVPGVLSTRASPNYYERLKLLLLTPFIPCQARLVVLIAMSMAIGGFLGAIIVPLVYLVSFLIFIGFSYLLHMTLKNKNQYEIELLLELPPFHRPYLRVIWWFVWHNLRHFLTKAGSIIILANVVLWILQHVTINGTFTYNVNESMLASLSKPFAFLLVPMGINNENAWIVVYAIMTGLIAKELVISSIILSTNSSSIVGALMNLGLNEASLVSLTLFISLYLPCLATLVAVYSESKKALYPLILIMMMFFTAYVLGILAYHIASMIL